MRTVHRRYPRRFLPAMAGYAALVVLRAMRAIARVIGERDERERPLDLLALVAMSCFFPVVGRIAPPLSWTLRRA